MQVPAAIATSRSPPGITFAPVCCRRPHRRPTRATFPAAQFTMGKRPEAVLREAPSAAIGPLRILVAEDNVVNQKVACHLLEKLGHIVVLASTGRQVLDILERQCPDVILMDVQMPEMGGLEATAAIRLKEKERGGHVPIIGLTAHALSGDREKCLQAGMDAYLAKPVHREDLTRVLAETMAVCRQAVPPLAGQRNGPQTP